MDVFKAIADPTRRKILLMVAEQPEHINAITEHFNMSRPAVSKHIKILEDAKLIHIETDQYDGRQRYCHIQLEALAEITEYLLMLEEFWQSRLNSLEQYLKKESRD